VVADQTATLSLSLENTGPDTCLLQDVRIGSDSSAAFSLGLGDGVTLLPAVEVLAGQTQAIPVFFHPVDPVADLRGTLEFEINGSPDLPRTQKIALHGTVP
jgi:hypothetical protein